MGIEEREDTYSKNNIKKERRTWATPTTVTVGIKTNDLYDCKFTMTGELQGEPKQAESNYVYFQSTFHVNPLISLKLLYHIFEASSNSAPVCLQHFERNKKELWTRIFTTPYSMKWQAYIYKFKFYNKYSPRLPKKAKAGRLMTDELRYLCFFWSYRSIRHTILNYEAKFWTILNQQLWLLQRIYHILNGVCIFFNYAIISLYFQTSFLE